MAHYTDWPEYPTDLLDLVDYPTQTDDVDYVQAWLINALVNEMIAVQTELGTVPKGSFADVKTRLNAPKIEVCNVFTSAGINACIDALGATGGIVFLPKGTYTIDSTITIDYSNTILMGSGWGTKLDASAWSTGHVINLNGQDYCQIRDLQIEGNAGGGNSKNLIHSSTSTHYSIIKNCYLHHSDNDGISLHNTDYFIVKNNTISNCDNNALFGSSNEHVQTIGNIINSCNKGIFFSTVKSSIISNNIIKFTTADGIEIESTSIDCIISANNLYNCGNNNYDIYVEDSSYINVIGNACKSAAGYSESGIYIDNSDYCNIIGNLCSTHDTSGITLDATSDNNHVGNNQLEGETTKIVNAGSSNAIINALAGAHRLGDWTTNYAEFKSDGELNLKGTARVNRHDYIPSPSFKKRGNVDPVEGWIDDFNVLDFSATVEKELYYTINIPYRWDPATDITLTVFWLHDTNETGDGASTRTVRWGLDYTPVAVGETVSGAATTTIEQNSAGGHDADEGKLLSTEFTTKILAANLATHDQVSLRFYRDATDAVNDTVEDVARLIGIHIEFVQNKLGEAT